MSAAYQNVFPPLRASSRHAFQQFCWRHPEWWMLAISLACWLLMSMPHGASEGNSGHIHHSFSWPDQLLRWIIMVPAMMFPLVIAPVQRVATRNLWSRRHRAILSFLLGYMTVWSVAGILGGTLLLAMKSKTSNTANAACILAIAAAWQLTPLKRRALAACDRTMPLCPRGWRSHRDCFVYGSLIARDCLLSCWIFMLAAALMSHNFLFSILVTASAAAERYSPRLRGPYSSAIIFTVAVVVLIFAVL
jgi:predicted metal-binding membrane protein